MRCVLMEPLPPACLMSSVTEFAAVRVACAVHADYHDAVMLTSTINLQEIQESIAETKMSTRNLLDNTVPPGLGANDKGEGHHPSPAHIAP